jgi:hypothetical protein
MPSKDLLNAIKIRMSGKTEPYLNQNISIRYGMDTK